MCESMVDIQSATAEIRQKKIKRKKKPQDENIMSASATQGGHKNRLADIPRWQYSDDTDDHSADDFASRKKKRRRKVTCYRDADVRRSLKSGAGDWWSACCRCWRHWEVDRLCAERDTCQLDPTLVWLAKGACEFLSSFVASSLFNKSPAIVARETVRFASHRWRDSDRILDGQNISGRVCSLYIFYRLHRALI